MPPTLRRRKAGLSYRSNYEGQSLTTPQPQIKWSKTQLFDVRIIESKQDGSVTKYKVHYIGWPSKYDQWVEDSNIVTRSSLEKTGIQDIFIFQLLNSIKDNLICSRGVDSLVFIRFPISSPEVASSLLELSTKTLQSKTGHLYRSEFTFLDVHSPDILFGQDWWYRIINPAGDFGYINRETVRFGFYERKPCEEYTTDMKRKLVHRGFIFFLQFVREKGNMMDINLLRCTLGVV